jgi:hypothetical protein
MKAFLPFALSCLVGLTALGQTVDKERPAPKAAAYRIVRFYPNPASDVIHFESRQTSQQPLQLRIFNFLGKKLVEVRRVTNTTRIDLGDFGRGLYLFQVVDARGQIIESGKFQVEK